MPSLYPKIPLLLSRTVLFLSSCTVSGVMFYFIAHLNRKGYALPWMFYFLQGSALATIACLFAMGIWNRFRSHSPTVSAVINATLATLWAVGFGLLVDAMKETITIPCTVIHWGGSQGILICSLYKTLFVGSGFGLIGSIAMTILDILAVKKLRRHAAKSNDRQRLLRKSDGGETEYMPVWTGHSQTPPGLEPSRDERM